VEPAAAVGVGAGVCGSAGVAAARKVRKADAAVVGCAWCLSWAVRMLG
jgi:hypothetical protein